MAELKANSDAATRSIAFDAGKASVHEAVTYDGQHQPCEVTDASMMGHFQLLAEIGRGGMGRVYRALDTSLERLVAVKVITGSSTSGGRPFAAIKREAIAQARINHPRVVTIYYVGRDEDEPFLAMELIEGSTLRERMSEGPLPYSEAMQIALQLATALRYAAGLHMVHGDIKPTNLMITRDGDLKLSDFGLARSTSEDQSGRGLSGTPSYMAPELLDDPHITIQSDMYAIGVTLFEMVFGRLPVKLDEQLSLQEQLQRKHSLPIRYPSQWPLLLPLELKAVLDRLLAPNPADRYASYDDLIESLDRIRPVSTTVAGIPLRAAAFAVDQSVLFLAFTPFAIVEYVSRLTSGPYARIGAAVRPWVEEIIASTAAVPILFILLFVSGWRTPGRYLFQLRITENHGLVLPPRRRMLRSLIRNGPMWVLAAGWFSGYFVPLVREASYVLVLAWLLAEVIVAIISPQRRSIHDWLCHSLVVLDIRPSQPQPNPAPDLVALAEPAGATAASYPPADPMIANAATLEAVSHFAGGRKP